MEITFWNFSKRSNSTKKPTADGKTISFIYKDLNDLHNPIIEVVAWSNWNYAKIGSIYFFVEKVETISAKLFRVSLKIDLLATYKDNVLSTKARVLYSTQAYDKNLLDNRVIASGKFVQLDSWKVLDPFASTDGTYAITVISNAVFATGFATTYFMSKAEMYKLVTKLLKPDTWEAIKQWWENPMDAIIECYWLPINVGAYISLGNSNIVIGEYDTEIVGHPPLTALTEISPEPFTLEIPWRYDDFRNLSPYTTLDIYIPGCGLHSLSPSDFYNWTTMTVIYAIDVSTGNMQVAIKSHRGIVSNISGNIKVILPIGKQQSRITSLVNFGAGAIATAALAISGHPAAAVTSGAYAVSNVLTPRETVNNAALNGSFLSNVIYGVSITLIVTARDTDIDPNTLSETNGRPNGKIMKLSELSGFVQTENASVAIIGFASEQHSINSLLNGGIYIE